MSPKRGEFKRRAVPAPVAPAPKPPRKVGGMAWDIETHGARLLEAIEQGDPLPVALDKAGEVVTVDTPEGPQQQVRRLPWRTVELWQERDPEFMAAYAAARVLAGATHEARAQLEADAATPETVGVAKLRVDLAKWRAKVANPKQYGERVDVTSDGQKLPAPVVQTMVINGVEVTF